MIPNWRLSCRVVRIAAIWSNEWSAATFAQDDAPAPVPLRNSAAPVERLRACSFPQRAAWAPAK